MESLPADMVMADTVDLLLCDEKEMYHRKHCEADILERTLYLERFSSESLSDLLWLVRNSMVCGHYHERMAIVTYHAPTAGLCLLFCQQDAWKEIISV